MNQHPVTRPRRRWAGAAGLLLICLAASFARASERPLSDVRCIVVPDREPWLAPVAAAAAARLKGAGHVPFLLVVPPGGAALPVALQRLIASQPTLVISTPGTANPVGPAMDAGFVRIEIGVDPTDASLLLARYCWGTSRKAVVASLRQPEAVIAGATLAAHLGIPFIPVQDLGELRQLPQRATALGLKELIFAEGAIAGEPAAPRAPPGIQRFEVLRTAAIERRLVRMLGADRIANLVLIRTPSAELQEDPPAWLAPYLSLVRGSLVLQTRAEDPARAEQIVWKAIERHKLRPRSVTILAGYDEIGLHSVRNEKRLGEYQLEAEPLTVPADERALSLGVGRIPFRMDVSATVVAQGQMRERTKRPVFPPVLLMANPKSEYSALPLCETVSRATAAEMRNFKLNVRDFYGTAGDDPRALKLAEEAALIIYQGHIFDQNLLPLDRDDVLFGDEGELEVVLDADGTETVRAAVQQPPPKRIAQQPTLLNGLPLVILQSCNSIDHTMGAYVFEHGGTGLIGSVTSIHSASGSSFVKALLDGALYRDLTVGEALRDARNYFFCLAALKDARRHKEQAKCYRVGLSFRYWGDPELKIFDAGLGAPLLLPPEAELIAQDRARVIMPRLQLKPAVTERYVAKLFPGSQTAGIVRKLPHTDQRAMMPLYFFCLTAPDGFATHGFRHLSYLNNSRPGAVFLLDDLERSIYMLYFPKETSPDEQIELEFKP